MRIASEGFAGQLLCQTWPIAVQSQPACTAVQHRVIWFNRLGYFCKGLKLQV